MILMCLYRFDVNLLHVLVIRPPTRLRRGGVRGAAGPAHVSTLTQAKKL